MGCMWASSTARDGLDELRIGVADYVGSFCARIVVVVVYDYVCCIVVIPGLCRCCAWEYGLAVNGV